MIMQLRLKRLTFPIRFAWVQVFQDIDASPAMTCLQYYVWIHAYFIPNAFGETHVSALFKKQSSMK